MKTKIKFLAVLISIIAINCENSIAQLKEQMHPRIGLKAGCGLRGVTGKDVVHGYTLGGYAGITSDIPFSKKFAIQPAIGYALKGSYFLDADMFDTYAETSLKLGYVTINLPVKYTFAPGWYVSAGPSFGVLTAAKYMNIDIAEGETSIKEFVRPVDYGIFAGAGYLFKNGMGLCLESEIGLTPIVNKSGELFDGSEVNLKGKNLLVTIGFYYLIFKFK